LGFACAARVHADHQLAQLDCVASRCFFDTFAPHGGTKAVAELIPLVYLERWILRAPRKIRRALLHMALVGLGQHDDNAWAFKLFDDHPPDVVDGCRLGPLHGNVTVRFAWLAGP
jgi:hypothetical protein